MSFLKYIVIALVVVLGWLIGWTNSTPVAFVFLNWATPEIPVSFLYFIFLFSGLCLGVLMGFLLARRKVKS